ncbi:MAG TPA: 50S ribosomal protein L28 [Terriglobales bacterium]|nr:50S ribosomal protein L28 [Terriglobales bacterium]
MARVCDLCGKGPQFGNRISHAHNVTKRRWNVNLQSARMQRAGGTVKARLCTDCIKSGKVAKPLRRPAAKAAQSAAKPA